MAYRKVITWNARFQPVYRDLVVDRAIFRDYCSICGIILHWKREQELNHYGTKLERGVGGEGGHCRGMIQCCSKNSALQWATQVQKLKKGTWWLAKTLNGVKPSSSIATPPPNLCLSSCRVKVMIWYAVWIQAHREGTHFLCCVASYRIPF